MSHCSSMDQTRVSVLVQKMFVPLCSRDARIRAQALEFLDCGFRSWINGKTPIYVTSKFHLRHGDPEDEKILAALTLKDCLPFLLMLAYQCPFSDVREKLFEILKMLEMCHVTVPSSLSSGPSSFIPMDEAIHPSTDNNETHDLFVDAFLHNNRLDHITQLMGFHPQYLDPFLRTQNYILKGDGPLPYDYRNYIAIMASARHRCTHLVRLQKQEFLLQGGSKSWLNGLDWVPQKLQNLNELNKILAHQPWLINKSHIEKLTKGKDNWSLSEVVHAIVILAHFHCLSTFVFGCGISAEIDSSDGHTFQKCASTSNNLSAENSCNSHKASDTEAGVELLMQKMKTISEQHEEASQEEKLKCFQKEQCQSAELITANENVPLSKSDILRYTDDPDFSYQDFTKREQESEIPTFSIQDYSWEVYGYSLLNRLYNDIGTILDEKFKITYDLTYYTMGFKNNVDTSTFRRAIWNYIQCMYGIRHDDYDYREVNELLEKPLKAYIKTLSCYPERTTKSDYDSVMKEFKHSEKVHVNLMMLEARMQAELLYALRAIMRYMT
ncbi:sestrin-1-like isoform X1 [Tachypleus tridentatus]|uniref:sestrin-1-like isoform X1 n=2 Tax=Tachypleus tridentatus TaxID=6853 RepID=UPI003FD59781